MCFPSIHSPPLIIRLIWSERQILSFYLRLTIWPGYSSTILHYESAIMMCTDVSHKVLRSETVLDFMVSLRQQCGDQRFPDICEKELVGLIVLTK